jgi:hypothetical protein
MITCFKANFIFRIVKNVCENAVTILRDNAILCTMPTKMRVTVSGNRIYKKKYSPLSLQDRKYDLKLITFHSHEHIHKMRIIMITFLYFYFAVQVTQKSYLIKFSLSDICAVLPQPNWKVSALSFMVKLDSQTFKGLY